MLPEHPAAAAAAVVAFLLELLVLAAPVCWAVRSAVPLLPRVLLVVLVEATLIALWALFGAPRAPFSLGGWSRLVFEGAWFGSGVALLTVTRMPVVALVLGVGWLVVKVTLAIYGGSVPDEPGQ